MCSTPRTSLEESSPHKVLGRDCVLMGPEFQVEKMESSGDGGDGRATVWVCLMPLSCIIKNGKFYITFILP